ncbi:unnamed protein product [Allacma fusca]|uniref:Uncharacterized protein n=1 Tax=Allacma fusca TaxID=39272 RepID=A0A8J2L7W9_9HEXA|nr:unnamed protein product [Allacma fusca]
MANETKSTSGKDKGAVGNANETDMAQTIQEMQQQLQHLDKKLEKLSSQWVKNLQEQQKQIDDLKVQVANLKNDTIFNAEPERKLNLILRGLNTATQLHVKSNVRWSSYIPELKNKVFTLLYTEDEPNKPKPDVDNIDMQVSEEFDIFSVRCLNRGQQKLVSVLITKKKKLAAENIASKLYANRFLIELLGGKETWFTPLDSDILQVPPVAPTETPTTLS